MIHFLYLRVGVGDGVGIGDGVGVGDGGWGGGGGGGGGGAAKVLTKYLSVTSSAKHTITVWIIDLHIKQSQNCGC